MNPEFWISIIINVTLIAVVIGVFYFTLASKVEQQVVINQSQYIADSFMNNIVPFISEQQKPLIIAAINKQMDQQKQSLTQQDLDAQTKNSQLTILAVIILSIVGVLGIGSSYALAYYNKINYFEILKSNLVLVLFVGLTEVLFLELIAKNYISVDPNQVNTDILNALS